MPQWEPVETLFVGKACTVLRARGPQGTVVLKRLLGASTAADRARLRYEHRLLGMLAERGARHVPRPLELSDELSLLTLVLEDMGGAAIARLLPTQGWPCTTALGIALDVATALVDVHRAGLVHKDINPNNIVVNLPQQRTQLIDFGIASVLPREVQAVDTVRQLEGTLGYMAPEQTGRMNRAVDSRSDLFSLGSTLYALLCGHAPFAHEDMGRMVYALLAEHPAPLREVPVVVGQIVAKLMAKAPEDRYRSAAGLCHDLRRALDEPDGAFALGMQDVSEVFTLSDRLVGREQEVGRLVEAWRATAPHGRHLAVVKGPSGIGKSSLIGELQRHLASVQGIFAAGKYDQLQRHVPFSALSHALASVCNRLLLEPAASLDLWRRRLQVALGNVGRALTDLCPALELIVGPQKALLVLPTAETENRLITVLARVLLALCREQPMALFFDDIQWADAGTLKLIAQLLQSTEAGRLLLIVAFRDNEVGAHHPVQALLNALPQANVFATLVEVQPLPPEAVAEWVSESLLTTPEQAEPLATLLCQKTQGNPFYLRDVLQRFYERELLRFEDGGWRWDQEKLAAAAVSTGVADSMLTHVASLPPQAQHVLGCGACLGVEFVSNEVATAAALPHTAVVEALDVALDAGLLFALDASYRFASLQSDAAPMRFRFPHDKVQQAAHDQLPEAALQRVHLAIGRMRQAQHAQHAVGPWVLDVAFHLNQAAMLLRSDEERHAAAEVNMHAARQALRAGTAATAQLFAERGLALLGEATRRETHALAHGLNLAVVGALILSGDLERAVKHLEGLLPTHEGPSEFEEIQRLRVEALESLGRSREAYEVTANALQALGMPFAQRAGPAQVIKQLLLVKWDMRGKSPDRVAEMRFGRDEELMRYLRVAAAGSSAVRLINSNYLAAVSLHCVHLVMQRGLQHGVADTFIMLMMMAAMMANWDDARAWARCVRRCVERDEGSAITALTDFLIVGFVDYLDYRPERLCETYEAVYVAAQEQGDQLVACYPIFMMRTLLTTVSVPEALAVGDKYDAHLATHSPRHEAVAYVHMRDFCQWLANAQHTELQGFEAGHRVAQLKALSSAARRNARELRVLYYLLCGQYAQAVDYAEAMLAEWSFDAVEAMLVRCRFLSLIALTQEAQAGAARRVRLPRLARKTRAKLRAVARANPSIHGGLTRLVDAEFAALRGQAEQAAQGYDEALHQLADCGHVAYVMLGAECAARFFRARGQFYVAGMYARQAVEHALRWGALRKVSLLRAEFAPVLSDGADKLGTFTHGSATGAARMDTEVDLPALMQVASALCEEVSEEVREERIGALMLEHTQRSAGATRAALVLQREGGVDVRLDTGQGTHGVPSDLVTLALRSRQAQVVQDVTRHLSQDAYWARGRAKCAMACPLLHRDGVLGVLYLENQLSAGVFSEDRRLVVELMARQGAIALHNAQVLSHLDAVVEEKTAQLQAAHGRVLRLERNSTEVQMAGGFAHEVRNALAGARYTLQSLVADSDAPFAAADSPELAMRWQDWTDAVTFAEHGVSRCMGITDQILQYAEASNLVPGDDTVALRALVEGVLGDYAQRLTVLSAHAEVHVSADLQALARKQHVDTILRNLIDNACDALARGTGERRLRVEAHLLSHGTGTKVALQVRDSGVGVPANQRTRLFNPFFSTKGAQGRGLGLGLSRKLAQAYGGDLRYVSEAATTAFEVTLPAPRRPE